MAFALNHAATHDLKRIIYVIPYTSIIEQNAGVFKDALGQENVLEHHSNFDWHLTNENGPEDDETNAVLEKLKLAAENWDIPIVVTTNVQFFESLFASKKSACRKLHNIARSVIVFDEAQMLPREYLRPCMLAVRELVQNYGASAVLCTATQPELGRLLPGITPVELAPNPQALFDFFRRVQIHQIGALADDRLAERLNRHAQALCVVNTRRHAKGLFDLLQGDGRYHLSTLMCPAHRHSTLKEIRARLAGGQPCRVVSTQVIEAGVDLDFPVGYRALAGLDSIIQAAGRVNRERRGESGDVFVFEPDSAHVTRPPKFIQQGAAVAANVLRDFAADPVSTEAIRAYFRLLDTLADPQRSYDANQVVACLDKSGFDFRTAAEKFRLIDDDDAVSIIIPYDGTACKLINELRTCYYPTAILRALQIYTVNIHRREYAALYSKGAIETIHEHYFILTRMDDYYHPDTGVVLPSAEGGDALFF
jgi:CRISPR-associated endonuclease/helicase Cas3